MAMNDVMATIRMPRSMAQQLRELAKRRHFLDISEEVRSIVRQKWISLTSPELFELKKLRENIEHQIRQSASKKINEEVARELEKIKASLKKERMRTTG